MIPYLSRDLIRLHVGGAEILYEKRIGRPISYPLNVEDFFYVLYGLETVYDTDGKLNELGQGIIGSLFPDGHASPFGGKDKIIAVNLTLTAGFDPTVFSELHTIAHEGIGHYELHFLEGVKGEAMNGPSYCRTGRKDPMEWQSDFAAGELIQPEEKVVSLLDGKRPGEIIDVESYEKDYRGFFGANRSMMETRLIALGYKLINAKYSWANFNAKGGVNYSQQYRTQEKQTSSEKWAGHFDSIEPPSFDLLSSDLSSILDGGNLRRGWKGKLTRMVKAEMYRNRRGKQNEC